MTIDTSTPWKSVSMVPVDMVIVARVSYGDGTKKLSVATRDIVINGEKFLGVLLAIPRSSYGISLRSNEYSIATIQLSISNLEYEPGKRYSDLFTELGSGSSIGFDHRKADIREWREGITTFEDCLGLFPNGMNRKPTSNRRVVIQDIEDRTELNLRKAFTDIVSDSDAADTDEGLPSDSRGKVKPIPYGDHTHLVGDDSKSLDTASSINNMSQCLYLGIDSTERHRWLVAAFQVNEILISGFLAQLWAWDDNLGRFVRLHNSNGDIVVEQNTSDGCIISHPNIPKYIDYFRGKGVPSTGSTGSFGTPFTNTARGTDKEFTLASRGGFESSLVVTNDQERMNISFPDWEYQNIDDALVDSILYFLYGKLAFTGAADTTFVSVGVASIPPVTFTNPVGASYPDLRLQTIASGAAIKSAVGTTVALAITALKNFGADTAVLDVYEFYKGIVYSGPTILPLYYVGKGKEYDFLTGRTNHADFSAGDGSLIENPSGCVESILRLGSGLGDSDIDTASFDTASNILDGLKASFSFINPITTKKVLADFGLQFRSFLWYQPDGTIKMQTIEDTYTTADRIIHYRDMLELDFDETAFDLLRTKVRVLYNWSRSKFSSKTDYAESSVAQTFNGVTGEQTEFELQAPLIKDETTAIAIRDFFLAQWKNIHNIAVVTVGALHLDLDIGDVVQLDGVPFKANGIDISQDDSKAGQTVYNKWIIYDINRSNVLKFKALQAHDLS